MSQRNRERLDKHQSKIEIHPWKDYAQIPVVLKRAVVAEEDANFMNHHGFDWQGIEGALKKDIRRHSFSAGGSTITQQLAKNLFLSTHRNLARKAEEALISLLLELIWDKKRILEVYLNVIEWGDGIFGCEAAAQHYFNKSVNQLSVDEAATLASMIPRPKYFDHHRDNERLIEKSGSIQKRMEQVLIPK